VQGVKLLAADGLEPARLDRELFSDAITEIVVNALESGAKECVEVHAFPDSDGRLVVRVTDDGRGMSEHALAHATDPFFSEKPAGRQTGLGLALAHRLLGCQNAALGLQSRPGRGTMATVSVSQWRWAGH
jgi:signal transduction histidine kinase